MDIRRQPYVPLPSARRPRDSLIAPTRRSSILSGDMELKHPHLRPLISRNALGDASSRMNTNTYQKSRLMDTLATAPPKVFSPSRCGDPFLPQECYDYDLEVIRFLFKHELLYRPSGNLFEIQSNITPRMRSTVIDWLVDVHRKLRMHTDTLYMTVNYMDRFLSAKDLDKSKYQMLACAAVLIAAKSEEIMPPSMTDLCTLAGNSFTEVGLARMEATLFATLDFNINPTVCSHFVRRLIHLTKAGQDTVLMAYYLNETCLLSHKFIDLKPSMLSSAIFCLALVLTEGPQTWSQALVNNTGYTLTALTDLVHDVFDHVVSTTTSKFQAIRKKYASSQMNGVSRLELPSELRLV